MKYYIIAGIALYFIVMSVIGIIITIKDKRAAEKYRHRVSEKKLMTIAILGGAFPMYITMNIIKHKTNHLNFMFGLPLMTLLHVIVCAVIYLYIR